MWRQELSLGKYKQTLLHPRGEKKGTYFNTSLSRRLLCLRQLSGHFLPLSKRVPFCFPKFSIQTLKLQYLAQHLSYNRALQPQHTEFCAQWAKLTIFLHSRLATFCDATFRLTLSKWWREGKTYQKLFATYQVIGDSISWQGEGPFLNAAQVIILKDALQVTHMSFNSVCTYPSLHLYLNHYFGWMGNTSCFIYKLLGSHSQEDIEISTDWVFIIDVWVQFPKLTSPFSINIPSSGATSSKETQDIFYARQKIVVVAKAFGLQAIDLVYIDFRDGEGLLRQSREGAAMGFTGMILDDILESRV